MAVAATGESIHTPAAPAARSRAAVRLWLYVLAALVVAMVAVGGATRLTGSGLSITEWRPVTGAIPPLSEAAWAAEFEKYRASPQYALLNQGMSLSEFRFIYWWEWGHRQLGRLIGLAFFVPFLWFWAKGFLSRRLALTLLAIGALGGLQGAVGWIMVASGLEPGMIAVAPVKLTLHLLIASAILVALLWVATGLRGGAGSEGTEFPPSPGRAARDSTLGSGPEGRLSPSGGEASLPRSALVLLALVFLQIALGGLVAGSKAGLTYNTWPLMDGRLAPPLQDLFAVSPWIENFVDNVALVQLNHRLVAVAVVAFAIWHAVAARRMDSAGEGWTAARRADLLAALALAQMALGIATLVLAVPLWAGLAHQILAMAVLGTAAVHARLCILPSSAAFSSH
ncbi:MAG TPA: COX15/CtaA family protein [Beijerinckiaceae bacterium]|jgi:cytochrome c oxidase assembly protein subunit 15